MDSIATHTRVDNPFFKLSIFDEKILCLQCSDQVWARVSISISLGFLPLVSTNSKSVINDIAKEYSNSLVNKTVQKSFREFTKGKIDILEQPTDSFENKYITKSVNLNLSESNLKKIGKEGIKDEKGKRRGTLGLDIQSLKAIKSC